MEHHPPLTWDGMDVTALMGLEKLDTNLFRSRYNQPNLNGALYGGQVFGQALAAANGTIEGRDVHSCHGYFLRPGQIGRRIIFEVERTRDGGSFSSRRVVALQDAVPILHLECSFHVAEQGFDHAMDMVGVPAPELLTDLRTMITSGGSEVPPLVAKLMAGHTPIEARPVDQADIFKVSSSPRRQCWVRVSSAGTVQDQATHRLILAYLSDFWLSGASLMPHAPPFPTEGIFLTSLDHAIWFHRDVRVDEWLLYDADSPSASHGLGFSRGLIYDRTGRLVASTAQEALIRQRR